MPLILKPERPAVVPAVPVPVPQRSDRKNFAVRGDQVLGWMPSGVAGINTNIGYVKDSLDYVQQESERAQLALDAAEYQVALAQGYAQQAMFTAHFKGQWAALAGALATPACVAHGGLFWALVRDLANVAASEPGGSANTDWVVLPGVAEIGTPTNLAPADAAANQGASAAITLQANAFASIYASDTHQSSQWQIHTFNAFMAPFYDSGAVAGATSFMLPEGLVLQPNTQYYWRVRYKSSRGTWSAWSRATGFVTAATFGQYIAQPAATPANFGDPFQGGYYFGMIWQEIAQATEVKALATGVTEFTLDAAFSMYVTPRVYVGQQLEVRSRAAPATKFVGTVVSANKRKLTLNVTAVAGAGTPSDWSIMSRFRLIKAPKASGEVGGMLMKSTATAMPTATGTLTDGWAATLAMVAAGDATMYPVAWWARSLSIGGYSDWYIPGRDELELFPRGLAGSNNGNYGTARPNAPIHNYANRGAYADAVASCGANLNSVPQGALYSGVFTLCPNTAFRSTQEGWVTGAYGVSIWSSTEYSATDVWVMNNGPDATGTYRQSTLSKNSNAALACAIRRSIV